LHVQGDLYANVMMLLCEMTTQPERESIQNYEYVCVNVYVLD